MLRALIALAVIVSCALPAAGDGPAAPWRAQALPPRPDLPTVEVDLGYPGPYVTSHMPVRLRARAGAQPFDGYIGFHLAVGPNKTMDTPAVARAVIQPNSEWRFETHLASWWGATRNLTTREVVVEWRNAQLQIVAERSVGRPPWSAPRPLRIAADGETVANETYLGTRAVVLPASALSADVQWYGGFSSVIVPTALWFELPEPVRQAVFRSGLLVHFFGVPAAMPQMSQLDRALLPVELQPGSGVVEVPWPYESQSMTTPLTWRPKAGARRVGSPSLPYLVMNDAAVFAASDEAYRTSRPAFAHGDPGRFAEPLRWRSGLPRLREIYREYGELVVFAIVLLISIVAAIAIRRFGRVATVASVTALFLTSLVVIARRERIRPLEGEHVYTSISMPAPGVADVDVRRRDYGRTPRALTAAQAQSLAGMTHELSSHRGEVRTNETLPGLGLLQGYRVWDGAVRLARRRELATPGIVRVVSRNEKELVIDFQADRPIDYVSATWALDGKRFGGEARTGSRTRGRVVIRDRHRLPLLSSIGLFGRMSQGFADDDDTELGVGEAKHVTLIEASRDRATVIKHIEHGEDLAPVPPYRVTGRMHDRDGVRAVNMVLPAAVPARANAKLLLGQVSRGSLRALTTMNVEGPAGVATVDIRGLGLNKGRTIPAAELRRVAPAGGIIRLSIDPRGTGADLSRAVAMLEITEEKQ